MPYLTFPQNPSFPGVYKGGTYKGTAKDAQKYGVIRKRLIDSEEDPEPIEHFVGHQRIEIGHRFVAKVTPAPDPEAEDLIEPWVPLRPQGETTPEFDARLVNKLDRQVKVDPGSNMRDPDGFVISPAVAQPGPGEQARNVWSGELEWEDEEKTIPKTVPS